MCELPPGWLLVKQAGFYSDLHADIIIHWIHISLLFVCYDFPIWHSLWRNQCWIHRICMAKLQCRSGALVRSYICHINVWRTCCRLAHFLWTWRFGAQKFEWCTQLCVLGTYIKHCTLKRSYGNKRFQQLFRAWCPTPPYEYRGTVYCIDVVCDIQTCLVEVISTSCNDMCSVCVHCIQWSF